MERQALPPSDESLGASAQKVALFLDSISSGPWLPMGVLIRKCSDKFGFGERWLEGPVGAWMRAHSKRLDMNR